MQRSLPVAERPRRPEWMKVRAPSADSRLLRRPQADPRREPEHDLRRGALPEHLRVLGPRHGDLPDPRRDLHARLSLLLRALRPAGAPARPARAASARGDRCEDGPQARGGHIGRPRRRGRPRCGSLRRDDSCTEAQGARGDDRDPDAGLPRRRGAGAADGARRAARRVQPQHRDGAPVARAHARRQGVATTRRSGCSSGRRSSPTTRC